MWPDQELAFLKRIVAKDAEITRLRGEILFKDDAINGLHGAYLTAADEIVRLRKALVWAAGRNLEVTGMGEGRRWFFRDTIGRTEFDGTDESLIETLCKLAEGE